ncbi:MAG: hypothetical protein E7323_09885 [Clostridiales bacterium]|nr:hypothetical protein [Clostridiales bacterium]
MRKFSWMLHLMLALLMALPVKAEPLLQGEAFVEQILVPMALADRDETFTWEELEQLLALAEKNGIQIPEEWLGQPQTMGSWYEDEMLKLIMKCKYGFYPLSWPWEVQLWWDERRYELWGEPYDQGNLRRPLPGEVTEEEAISIAKAQAMDMMERYQRPHKTFEEESCVMERSFYQPLGTTDPAERVWYITIFWMDDDKARYTVILSPDGVVKEAH